MVQVTLTAALARFANGETELELNDVTTIKQLFRSLSERYPEMKPHLENGIAVAIDGQLFQDSLLEPIEPNSEVHLLPQIGGG
jgi:molybdopterin synthase sulfur carrier subunit